MYWRSALTVAAAALLATACGGEGPSEFDPETCAEARVISSEADRIGGSPVARAQAGDFLLQNNRIRVAIQDAGRDWWGGIDPYGGVIIDADIRRDDPAAGRDDFEVSVLSVNLSTIPNYQSVEIIDDGFPCDPAVIRAEGPVDLTEYINPSSQVAAAGLNFPDSADDVPLPVTVRTDYILEPDSSYVTQRTTLINQRSRDLDIFLGELISPSGEIEPFQPRIGFGEPQLVPQCPMETWVQCRQGQCDPCNMLAMTGFEGGRGIAYGRIHEFFNSSGFNAAGVNTILYGENALAALNSSAEPNFTVPGDGKLELERYFAVTAGSVADVQKIRNDIFGVVTGTLEGAVLSGGEPVADADVAITRPDPNLDFNVVSQDRTDAEGRFSFDLPPGDYDLRVHQQGREFPASQPVSVSVAAGETVERDIDMPAPGFLTVNVEDGRGDSIPARVQLVGFDPSPPLTNSNVFASAGVFFDNFGRISRPFGIALATATGPDGTLSGQRIEPGDYELVVSRGLRYSAHRERITITADTTTERNVELRRVVDTPGFVTADFHVHGINSLDSKVPLAERVRTHLAAGMDFFTPADHGFQVDYQPTIESLGAEDLISTASGAELTTPDYGHFNAWPRTVVDDEVSGGSTDWGWGDDVPAGRRFPAFGNYVKTPEELFARAKDDVPGGFDPIVQINHADTFFNGAGLAIDTALTPPQSTVDPRERRLDPNLPKGPDTGIANHFAANFDALELWIGVRGRSGTGDLTTNMADWFNLINQGIVRTGVASSDTHDREATSLATRSLVASSVTDPGQLRDNAQALADAVDAGKVVLTNGPFVTIEATDGNNTAGLGIDQDTLLANAGGEDVTVDISVRSPAWAEFDTVELFVNNAPAQTSSDPPRYTVCPDRTLSEQDGDFTVEKVAVNGAMRLEADITTTLANVTEDTWVVARVSGTDGVSEPLFPVAPASLDSQGNDTLDALTDGNLGEGGLLATAVTNPLFIATDGDWSAPGVSTGSCPDA